MAPLHLDILMHYYTRGGDYDQLKTNRTRWEYAYELAEAGYLYTPDLVDGEKFAITKQGKKLFDSVMAYATGQAKL